MKKLYFDMDGTCADFFEESDCLERMYEKGFFRSLNPFPLANIINLLAKLFPEQVFTLSASLDITTDIEKNDWINMFMPNVHEDNRIFTRVGEDKSESVNATLDAVLIDDYSKNLLQWEHSQGETIKALNGINNKHNRWGKTIDVKDGNDCLFTLIDYLTR